MKTTHFTFIYISQRTPTPERNIDLRIVSALQKYGRTVHFPVYNETLSLKKTILKGLPVVITQIYSILFKKHTSWIFFGVLPFERFQSIQKLNLSINKWLINTLFKRNSQLVVIISDPPPFALKYLYYFAANILIADILDIDSHLPIKLIHEKFDFVLTNAKPLYEYHSQFSKKTNLVPAGYFSEKLITQLLDHKYRSKKKVIFCLANISWRINIKFVLFLVKRLPQYTFIFCGPLLYLQEIECGGGVQMNRKFHKDWERLKNFPNFIYIHATNQEQLLKLKIKANIGIYPADPTKRFNKYCHPMKLYDYFAMRLPVVSTPIPSIKNIKLSSLVFANEKEEFARAIEKLTTRNVNKVEQNKMLALAFAQTTEEKAKAIFNLVTKNKKLLV